ncbi:MAG TPA: tetratricopeptide repeat protein [Gammaproteobacteria bacterium]|nr:tetratricopeptide repeat protein [Gammaproteobacteria bacterium]
MIHTEKLKQALAFQQKNKLTEAVALLENILSEDPENPDALHGLGLCYVQNHQLNKALPYLKKAVILAPKIPGFHNNLGNLYKALGQLNAAEIHYQEALRLKSPYPEALNNLAALYYLQGQTQTAINLLKKAIREDPDSVDAHYNLGNCLASQERLLEANTHYQKVLELHPDHLAAMHNLGISLTTLKDFTAAKPLLANVLAKDPNNLNAAYHLGIIEGALGNVESAQSLYQKVIALDPNHGAAHHNLATLFLLQKQSTEALKHYQIAYQLMPENQTAKHMIAALTGQTDPAGAPLEYVRALFDQYAYNYDQHVQEQLHYQVPFLLRQTLTPYINEIPHPWDVLDLGCGTGLCLPYFNDIAGKIIGVDLSPTMIEVARQKGGYYALHTDDIESHLEKQQNQFDLILAADVFVYFGQLQTIFAKCFRALKTPGFFAFSIETSQETGHPFTLQPSGRYKHHPNYILQLAKDNQFLVKTQQAVSLRRQENSAVEGYLFVLKKMRK